MEEQYTRAVSLLNGQLYQHQKEGVSWLLSMENLSKGPKGGFLCDEMGLGKSIQMISTILGNVKRNTLIIVPKSIVTQWKNEITHFAPSLNVFIYDGPDRTRNPSDLLKSDITIAPYSLLTEDAMMLHKINWERVVLDEGHEIRNPSSSKFKAACQLRADIRWILSGTPVFNSMKDFVTLCTFIGVDRKLVQAMTSKVKNLYILRRTKEDNPVLEIPECKFENVELEMYPEERELYKHAFIESQETIKDIFRSAINVHMYNMEIFECLLRARQSMIYPQMYINGIAKKRGEVPEFWEGRSKKMETLFKLISEHPDEKSLVFCQFKQEMEYICENLSCPVFRIDGSVSKEDRETQLKLFNEAPQNSVFLIQVKAGGQGLNIQCASRVYFTAPCWNPATELQAIGRAHRSGQRRTVHVKKLVYKDTPGYPSVEQAMIALQGHKSLLSAEVLKDDRLKYQIPTGNKTSDTISITAIRNIFRA
jgi:SNF2 family DNA or RNA helicase